MKIERQFTKAGRDAYAGIPFTTTASEIRNPDGKVVFRLDGIEVPDTWSQVASDVIAQAKIGAVKLRAMAFAMVV